MSLFRNAVNVGKMCAVAAVVLAARPMTHAGWCLTCREKCPPPYIHCAEGPPCIKFKCACPKPVCDPCSLEHYGYYQTCWRPSSFQPDWSHCPVPAPAIVLENALAAPALPPVEPHPMPAVNGKR